MRIYQAVPRPVVRHDAVGPPTPAQTGEEARAGPRPIEGGAAGQSSRGAPDPRTRDGPTDRSRVPEPPPRAQGEPDERELRARDMAVRAEVACESPDAAQRPLPSFEYSRGPDGRVYATGSPPKLHAPAVHDPPESSDEPAADAVDVKADERIRGPEPPLPGEQATPPPEQRLDDDDTRARDPTTDRETIVSRTRDGPESSRITHAYVRAASPDETRPAFDEVA